MLRPSLLALLSAVGLALAHLWYYVPRLPERLATHFGAQGAADGWSSRQTFVVFALILVASFALLPVLLNVLLRFLPASMINIPNRDYWLTPQRRVQTLTELKSQMEWYGAVSVLFALAINHATVIANIEAATPEEARLGSLFLWAIGAYLGWTVLWIVHLYRRFRKPADAVESAGSIEPV